MYEESYKGIEQYMASFTTPQIYDIPAKMMTS